LSHIRVIDLKESHDLNRDGQEDAQAVDAMVKTKRNSSEDE
jgi:hypothetical protein